MARTPSGISVPPVTSAPAATRLLAPTVAWSRTVAWLAISASAPMVQACTTQLWPMVAPGPISTGPWGPACRTEPSCTFAPSRTTTEPKSARSTALNQTEAPASTVTSPISEAVGATKAVGWTVGDLPSNEYSGTARPYGRGPVPGLSLPDLDLHRLVGS